VIHATQIVRWAAQIHWLKIGDDVSADEAQPGGLNDSCSLFFPEGGRDAPMTLRISVERAMESRDSGWRLDA
jgi:hypothetical protein